MYCSICDSESFATHVHETCEPKDQKVCTREAVEARKNHQVYHSFPEKPVVHTPDKQSLLLGSTCLICGKQFLAGRPVVDICLRAFSPTLIKRAARKLTRKA